MTLPLALAMPSRTLAEQTARATEGPTDLRMGTITEVTAYGVTVDVGGGTVSASHLDSYAPAVGHVVALQRVMDAWLCLGRPVGSGTNRDGGTAGSGMGLTTLAGVTLTGSGTLASSSGSEVPIPGMSLSFFHPPGHTVLLLAAFHWTATSNTDYIVTRWRTNGGGQVSEWSDPVVNSAIFRLGQHLAIAPAAVYGGRYRTYYLNMERVAGAGTITVSRQATNPSYALAVDVGDSSLVKAV